MQHFSWDSMGTRWAVLVDGKEFEGSVEAEIKDRTDRFDKQFSRFIPTSEACSFRQRLAGTYPISKEFAVLLQLSDAVRTKTNGAFDPAIGGLLELAGYDPSYSFKQSDKLSEFVLPEWSLEGNMLTIRGPIVFDIGGIGKGYWIDQIARILVAHGYDHYLVDGGGDMVGTSKADGSPWDVALEWPGDAERAIGTIKLQGQGLAVSDVYKRRWGSWHHLVQAKTAVPTDDIIWCAVVAPDATHADMGTSLISFSQHREGTYLYIDSHMIMHRSPTWQGDIF